MRLTSTRPLFCQPGSATAPRATRSRTRAAAPLMVLALVLAGCGEGMNSSADPAAQAVQEPEPKASMDGMDMGGTGDGEESHEQMRDSEGNGLEASLLGLNLTDVDTDATSESPGQLSFRIKFDNDTTARDYVRDQGKYLHTYLVSPDLSTYLHVHPVLSAGKWSVDVPALPPGQLHMVASFVAADSEGEFHGVTLGTELDLGGTATATPLPKPVPAVKVDGYTVTLDGDLSVGKEAELNLTVTEGGQPVTLEPYLESWAHTSAFAADSLALSHLHSAQEWKQDADSPEILTFDWTPDAAGDYRFFIEFRADGDLHRAEFTRTVN